jgi:hypothetical protein
MTESTGEFARIPEFGILGYLMTAIDLSLIADVSVIISFKNLL